MGGAGVKKDTSSFGPAHIGALGECLAATHGILDTILSIRLDVLLTLPVIFCKYSIRILSTHSDCRTGVRAIYAIVCLMKMWVAVTSSTDVSAIIKKEDLAIETYTERLVAMFNAIVSRDAQSPHGKFFFVAKRLQERFDQIKEGAAKSEQGESESERQQQSTERTTPQSSTVANQTPLHLLSEVAMGSSNTATQQQQRSQQQAQAALQATQQPMQTNWYASIPQPQLSLDQMGFPQGNFDPNFDFTQFDLGTGSDADLSALFIPDAVMWHVGPSDPDMQSYGF